MKKLTIVALGMTLTFSAVSQAEEYKLFTKKDGSRVSYIPWDNGQKYCLEPQKEGGGFHVYTKEEDIPVCTPNSKYISEEYICKKGDCDFVFDSKNDLYALYSDGKTVLILTSKSDYKAEMPWVSKQIKEKRERIIDPPIEVNNIYIGKNEDAFNIFIPQQGNKTSRNCDKTGEFCFDNNGGQLNFMEIHHVKNTPEATGEIETAFISCKNNGEFFIKTDNGAVFSVKIPRDGCQKREVLMKSIGL